MALPYSGVRYAVRREWFQLVTAVVLAGLTCASFVEIQTWGWNAPRPDQLLSFASCFPLLAIAALRRLYIFAFPWGITVANGRIGWARKVGPWLLWSRSREMAEVQSLVVRSRGTEDCSEPPTRPETRGNYGIVVCGEAFRPLLLKWTGSREFVLRIAQELAGHINRDGRTSPVNVVCERVGYSGERSLRPVLSRVAERIEPGRITFPVRTRWRHLVHQPEPPRTGNGIVGLHLLIPAIVLLGGALLGFAVVLVGTVGHLAGQGNFHVGIGPLVLVRGGPNSSSFWVRFGEALLGLACGLLPLLLMGATGGLLLRWVIRDYRSRRGDVRTGWGRIEITADGPRLILRKGRAGRIIAEWPREQIASLESFFQVVTRTSSEGGDSSSEHSGLKICMIDGQVWSCETGAQPEDWEWIATQMREVLQLPRVGR